MEDEYEALFHGEKKLMKAFMMMKHQEEVPSYITVKNMRKWLLSGRDFLLDEYHEMAEKEPNLKQLHLLELLWKATRRLRIEQMEEELRREVEEEHRLSLLLGRRVTMEGLDMFLGKTRPAAEEEVKKILLPVFSSLLTSFMKVKRGSAELYVQDRVAKMAEDLSPEIVKMAYKHLLEARSDAELKTPTMEKGPFVGVHPRDWKWEVAAAKDIRELVEKAAIPFLSQCGDEVAKVILSAVTKAVALDMVRAISVKLTEGAKTFRLLGFDGQSLDARVIAMDAVWEMDMKVKTASSRLPQIPRQIVVLDVTLRQIFSEILLLLNQEAFVGRDSESQVNVLTTDVMTMSNFLPWVQVTEVEELANVLLQDCDKMAVVRNVISELEELAYNKAALKRAVGDGSANRHIAFLVGIAIGKRVPDTYSTSAEERLVSRLAMEEVLIFFEVIGSEKQKMAVAEEEDRVEDATAALLATAEPSINASLNTAVLNQLAMARVNIDDDSTSTAVLAEVLQKEEVQKEEEVKMEEMQKEVLQKEEVKKEEEVQKEEEEQKEEEVQKEEETLLALASQSPIMAPHLLMPTELMAADCSRVASDECSEDGADQLTKKKKKGGVRRFFRHVWKMMKCSSGIEEDH